jgi:hypothetical protein
MRSALELLLRDDALRADIVARGQATAQAHFGFEAYVEALEAAVMAAGTPAVMPADVAL